MKTKSSLFSIVFHLFFSLYIQGQTFDNACWIDLEKLDVAICFIGSDSIQFTNLHSKSIRTYGMKIKHPHLIISHEGETFDSIQILKEKKDSLDLQIKSSSKKFNLFRSSLSYSKEQVENILNHKNIKLTFFRHQNIRRKEYIIQDTLKFNDKLPSICFNRGKFDIDLKSFGIIINPNLSDFYSSEILVTEIANNQIKGIDLDTGNQINFEIIKEKTTKGKQIKQLVAGNYIQYKNQEKLQEGLNRGEYAIHVGYPGIELREDGIIKFSFVGEHQNDFIEGSWEVIEFDELTILKLILKGIYEDEIVDDMVYLKIESKSNKHLIINTSICDETTHGELHKFYLKKLK